MSVRPSALPSVMTSGPTSKAFVLRDGRPRPPTAGSVCPFHESQPRDGAAAAPVSKDGKRVETPVGPPQPAVSTPDGKDAVRTAVVGASA